MKLAAYIGYVGNFSLRRSLNFERTTTKIFQSFVIEEAVKQQVHFKKENYNKRMDIEVFLAEQREKIQKDKNRILTSTFTKEVPKNLFLEFHQKTRIVTDDLNANSVEVEEPQPESTSAKLSSLTTVPDDNAQKENILEIEQIEDVSSLSKDSKNAANQIQLLQVTHDENNSSRSSSARKSKVSDFNFIAFDKLCDWTRFL